MGSMTTHTKPPTQITVTLDYYQAVMVQSSVARAMRKADREQRRTGYVPPPGKLNINETVIRNGKAILAKLDEASLEARVKA
jgi:hypothetical protein